MGRVQAHPADRRIAKSIEYHRKLYQIINAMDHYTGNITPDKDIIPDNIWYCEEWYKAAHNRLSCEQEVPLDAGASRGMVQRDWEREGKKRAAAGRYGDNCVSQLQDKKSAGTKGGGTGGCHRADGNGGTDRPNGIFGLRGQKLTKKNFFPIPSAKKCHIVPDV